MQKNNEKNNCCIASLGSKKYLFINAFLLFYESWPSLCLDINPSDIVTEQANIKNIVALRGYFLFFIISKFMSSA